MEVIGACPLCGGREYDNGIKEHTTLCIEHRELKDRVDTLSRSLSKLEGLLTDLCLLPETRS